MLQRKYNAFHPCVRSYRSPLKQSWRDGCLHAFEEIFQAICNFGHMVRAELCTSVWVTICLRDPFLADFPPPLIAILSRLFEEKSARRLPERIASDIIKWRHCSKLKSLISRSAVLVMRVGALKCRCIPDTFYKGASGSVMGIWQILIWFSITV